MPGNGTVAEPGLVVVTPGSGVIMMPPVSVCHQVSTIGQRPPPMCVVVPDPGLGVDRLADAAEQAQGGQVVPVGMLGAPLHEGADGGGRGVEDGDAVASRRVRQNRSRSGQSGAPSYISTVAPLASGP